MNPLSAFSFGKIIKTFIPGLLAASAVILVLELLYRMSLSTPCAPRSGFWGCFFGGALVTHLVLPVALFAGLGWFLVVAGLGNLRRYQEGFVWFLVGTLHFRPNA